MEKLRMILLTVVLSFLLMPISSLFAQEQEEAVTLEDEAITVEEPDYLIQILEDEEFYPEQLERDEVPYDYEDTTYYDTTDAGENLIIPSPDGEVTFAGLIALYMTLILFGLLVLLVMHFIMAVPIVKLGKEMQYKNSWYGWIPILQIAMLLELGKQKPLLILLIFVPGIGALIVTILQVLAMMEICEARGYEKLLGLLVLFPPAYLVLLYLLAWQPKTKIPETPVQ